MLNSEELIRKYLSCISKPLDKGLEDYKKLEEIKSRLKTIKTLKDPTIILELLKILNSFTRIKEFKELRLALEDREFIPIERLIEYVSKTILKDRDLKEYGADYYKIVFKFLKGFFRAVYNEFYSTNLTTFMERVTDFFELFYILLKKIPIRTEIWIEANLDKWGGKEVEFFEESLEFVLENEFNVLIEDNRLKIRFEDLTLGEEEKIKAIEKFNKRAPLYQLNQAKIIKDRAYEQIWLKQHIKNFHSEEEYTNWLKIISELIIKERERKFIEDGIDRAAIIQFRGAKIPRFEASVIEEIEFLSNKKLKFKEEINKITYQHTEAKEFNDKIMYYNPKGFYVENNRIKGLAFRESNLIALPESIGKLKELEFLDLQSNKLKKIPETINNLKNLQILILKNNCITKLPDHLENLKILDYIDLAGNKLVDLPKTIGDLPSLKYLNLQYNKIEKLPDEITKLNSLKTLNLASTSMQEIPESVDQLKELRVLILSKNRLSMLPANIGNLKKLKVLELNENDLNDPFLVISHLTQLQRLSINGPQGYDKRGSIEAIRELDNFSDLKSLSLNHNKISEIKGLSNLRNLEYLDLSYNDIYEMKGLKSLINLKSLILEHNQIKEIKELDQLENLNFINLNYNYISKIKGLETLKDLRYLNLGHNEIEELSGLGELSNLTSVILQDNKINNIIYELGGFDHIGYVKNPKRILEYCKKKEG